MKKLHEGSAEKETADLLAMDVTKGRSLTAIIVPGQFTNDRRQAVSLKFRAQ